MNLALLPTTTTFIPEAGRIDLDAPDSVPIPRIEAALVPNRSVSESAEEIRFAGEEQLKGINAQLQSRGKKQQVVLPTVTMPGVHSALCLRYTSGCAATVEVVFRDPDTGEQQFGKTNRIRPSGQGSALLELPTPDFKTLRTELTVTPNSSGARLQLQDVFLLADHADEDALIKIISRTANTVTVSIGELKDYRILTFLDSAYPGWKAYLDGKETPILLADDAFKAVLVPPGTHEIRFTFRPKRLFAGLAVTLTTVLASLAGIALLRPARPS